MANRKTFATGAIAGATVCTLILACSSSSPPAQVASTTDSGVDASTTPVGATPVTSPPFAGCASLQPGCYTFNGSYVTPATTSCSPAGSQTAGEADTHCAGQPAQAVS